MLILLFSCFGNTCYLLLFISWPPPLAPRHLHESTEPELLLFSSA